MTLKQFNKKYFPNIDKRGKAFNVNFKPFFSKNKEEIFKDAEYMARLKGRYALICVNDNGYTFLPCDCNGYVYDISLLEGIKLNKVLRMNANLIG